MSNIDLAVEKQIKELYKKIKFAGKRLGLDLAKKSTRDDFFLFHDSVKTDDWRAIMDGKTDALFFLSQSLNIAMAMETFATEDKIALLGEAFHLVGLAIGVTGNDRTPRSCPTCIEMNYASSLGKRGADSTHDKPNGSRAKRAEIILIWATGKYSNRDLCAEQECAALGMSFSTARKALRNTPEPTRAYTGIG